MADEGEIDVLGDFDLKLEADGNIYDSNELPSKSANLLPEFTDPPWMLEQGWTLDNSCMDEKSKATIEKMLLEEQYYISGKSSRAKQQLAMSVAVAAPERKKAVWTNEEKDMFHRGMEIYGRSWTKIAELIPTRTSTQIKNFAHQLFRTHKKDNKDSDISPCKTEIVTTTTTSSSSALPDQDPLTETMATVTTAWPTVKAVKKSVVPKRGRISAKEKLALQSKSASLKQKSLSIKKCNNKLTAVHSSVAKRVSRITKPKDRGKVHGKVTGSDNQGNNVNKQTSGQHLSDMVFDKKLTISPGLIENLDGFCAVADIISGENDDMSKNDESDDDIHVDIENDDDSDSNPILIGRSTSPNSVYEKLLIEANLNDSAETDMKDIYSNKYSDNGRAVKNFLEWKTCESQKNVHEEKHLTEVVESGKENFSKIKEESAGCTADLIGDRANGERNDTSTDGTNESCVRNLRMKEEILKQMDSQKVLVNAFLKEDGEAVHFPVPASEVTLEPNIITEQEKEVLKEFFENRLSKTPERYLKIRNYIIESWKKCRPGYLNKTSGRSGLKHCGDVNSIGRVHAYLECIGAINFGCEQAAYKHPRYIYSLLGREKVSKDVTLEVNTAKMEAMRPRKRKVKDAFGLWIDEKDLEGMTFEHGILVKDHPKETKQKQIKTTYDPFKLIPCLSFTEDDQAPFLVEVHCSALIVMDIHSHISKTEVIGMLGGKFCVEQDKLTITMATPCNSISTGMQCEMDPVSQTQASEEIRGSGMDVVGWYHSHPSFAPNPSVRDIETQLKFQDWFSKGGSYFVGVIVSPYNPRNMRTCSEVNCLTASKEVHPKLQCNIPYKFCYTTRPCDVSEVNHIMLTAQDLATSYSNYPNRVDLASTYSSARGITCLEKMLESLKAYCPEENAGTRQLLESVRKAFTPVGSAETVDTNSSCDTSDNLSTDS